MKIRIPQSVPDECVPEYRKFLSRYVTTFLATWTAQHYNDYCLRSLHNALENPPVEDAFYLAEKAWEIIQDNTLSEDV